MSGWAKLPRAVISLSGRHGKPLLGWRAVLVHVAVWCSARRDGVCVTSYSQIARVGGEAEQGKWSRDKARACVSGLARRGLITSGVHWVGGRAEGLEITIVDDSAEAVGTPHQPHTSPTLAPAEPHTSTRRAPAEPHVYLDETRRDDTIPTPPAPRGGPGSPGSRSVDLVLDRSIFKEGSIHRGLIRIKLQGDPEKLMGVSQGKAIKSGLLALGYTWQPATAEWTTKASDSARRKLQILCPWTAGGNPAQERRTSVDRPAKAAPKGIKSELWADTLADIERSMGPEATAKHFAGLSCISDTGGVLVLAAATEIEALAAERNVGEFVRAASKGDVRFTHVAEVTP